MRGNEHRDSTRSVKRNRPSPTGLCAGRLYTVQAVMKRMGVGRHTIERWQAAGLRIYRPGTKREFVFSDEVFAIVRLDQLPPAYESPHKARNAARKKKRE